MTKIRQEVYKAFGQFEIRYGAKYPKSTEYLTKDKVEMLAFYNFLPRTWHIFEGQTPLNQCLQR